MIEIVRLVQKRHVQKVFVLIQEPRQFCHRHLKQAAATALTTALALALTTALALVAVAAAVAAAVAVAVAATAPTNPIVLKPYVMLNRLPEQMTNIPTLAWTSATMTKMDFAELTILLKVG